MGKTLVERLAAVAAGAVLALAAAAPALAQDTTTVELNPDHIGTTAGDFGEQECEGQFGELGDDEDGWHFILTQYEGELADLSMSIDFEDASGATVHVDAASDDFVESGGAVHLFLTTDAELTLVAAEAIGPADAFGNNPRFNLSHTCPGTPGNGETPPPGGETPPPGEETPPPGENGGETPPPDGEGGENGGGLAVTGVPLGGLLVLGSGLLAAGVAMVAIRRRTGIADPAES